MNPLNYLETLLKQAISGHTTALVITAVTLAALALLVRWTVPATARLLDRIRRGSLLHPLPTKLHAELAELLCNEPLRELYEPASRYTRDLQEDEKRPRTNGWTSAYADAVKKASKARKIGKGQAFDAKRQIKEMSEHITVRPLTDKEQLEVVVEDPKAFKQFAIELHYDGHNPSELERLFPAIKTQLGLRELFETDDDNPRIATLIASKTKITDPLATITRGAEFFEEHPATKPTSLPMAFTADGKTWSLPTHHTFVYGTTGTGKSGPLLAAIRQMEPFVHRGTVRLYAIDPKSADLKMFAGTDLVETVALDALDAVEVINRTRAEMEARTKHSKIDLAKGETGQEFDATRETPWTILIIDELFSLKADLESLGKEGKASWTNLEVILAKGRSAGFFVIAASQFAERENLKNLRPNFANVIVLGQPSAYLNDLFLGEGAAERGYDSTKIPPSNKANGYKYSGIGFVKGESGEPVKVRFARLAKEELAPWAHQFEREPAIPDTTLDAIDNGALPPAEHDTDTGTGTDWTITSNDEDEWGDLTPWEDLPPLN